jgi:hypothetical protein
LTVTLAVALACMLRLSVTVQTTVIAPGVLYMWLRVDPAPVVPSPRSQE